MPPMKMVTKELESSLHHNTVMKMVRSATDIQQKHSSKMEKHQKLLQKPSQMKQGMPLALELSLMMDVASNKLLKPVKSLKMA